MEIDYECKRCGKVVKAIVTRSAFKSKNYEGKKHNRLDCKECGRYIKFIGKRELAKHKNVGEIQDRVTLEEINFKLDLILEYLTRPAWGEGHK